MTSAASARLAAAGALNEVKGTTSAPGDHAREPAVQIPDHFVVFDLETTGLDPEFNEIIEIGAIRVDIAAGARQYFQSLVLPRHSIPAPITALTGITQAMLDEAGRPVDAALGDFFAFAGDLPLVTFAAEFDMAFLRNAIRRGELPIEIHNRVSCALKMARKAWPFLPSYRLADLASDAAVYTQQPHRALGDSERALLVYLAAARELIATRD